MEEHQCWHRISGWKAAPEQRSIEPPSAQRLRYRGWTVPGVLFHGTLAFATLPSLGLRRKARSSGSAPGAVGARQPGQGEQSGAGGGEERPGRAQRTWGRAGRGPLPSSLSGAGGEPQTKSRGRSRAGTGARRGRPGGGDAAGAAARGTGEPSPGAGRRSLGLRSPGTKGSCCPRTAPWPGLPGTMAGCEPRRARALLLLLPLALCSLSAAQPRQRQ